jgi:hypothetical protein
MCILMLDLEIQLSGGLAFDLALATCGVHIWCSDTYGPPLPPATRRVEIWTSAVHLQVSPATSREKALQQAPPASSLEESLLFKMEAYFLGCVLERDRVPRIHSSRNITWRMVATVLTSLLEVLLLC